jgi:hypothetical protein
MHPSHTTEDAIIHIVPWKDALVEGHGYAIDDPYIEMFWLPILGPTATWLVRRLAGGLQHQHEGYTVDMTDLARGIGVNYTPGRHNPFARALSRCTMFGAAQQIAVQPHRTIAVRSVLPPLPARHLSRLPHPLRIAHHDWVHMATSPISESDASAMSST